MPTVTVFSNIANTLLNPFVTKAFKIAC